MHVNSKKMEKASHIIYTILFLIYTIFFTFSSSYIDEIFNYSLSIIQYIVWIGLVSLYFFRETISIKKLIVSILGLVLIFAISNTVVDKALITNILFLVCYPENLNLEEINKKLLITLICVVGGIVLLASLGIITNYTFYRENHIRKSMGFVSANVFANLVTLIIMIYACLKGRKWNIVNVLLSLIILVLVNNATNSRLAFGIGILTIILAVLNKITVRFEKYFYLLVKYSFIIFFVFCLSVTIYFSDKKNTKEFVIINEVTTGRLGWIETYYEENGINLFGNNIVTVGKKSSVQNNKTWRGIDNAYMYALIKYGIIYILIVSYLYFELGKYLREKKMINEAIFIFLICLIGLTENITLYPSYNIALIIIGKILSERKTSKKNE